MRLAAQAKMGYYPTPPSVVPLIKDFLIRNGKGNIKLMDPCAGEGTALKQIGDKVLKVSFTEYIGRRKKTTRIEVKKSELDKMMKEKDGPVSVQLRLF